MTELFENIPKLSNSKCFFSKRQIKLKGEVSEAAYTLSTTARVLTQRADGALSNYMPSRFSERMLQM
jgi:hypothetical protein